MRHTCSDTRQIAIDKRKQCQYRNHMLSEMIEVIIPIGKHFRCDEFVWLLANDI